MAGVRGRPPVDRDHEHERNVRIYTNEEAKKPYTLWGCDCGFVAGYYRGTAEMTVTSKRLGWRSLRTFALGNQDFRDWLDGWWRGRTVIHVTASDWLSQWAKDVYPYEERRESSHQCTGILSLSGGGYVLCACGRIKHGADLNWTTPKALYAMGGNFKRLADTWWFDLRGSGHYGPQTEEWFEKYVRPVVINGSTQATGLITADADGTVQSTLVISTTPSHKEASNDMNTTVKTAKVKAGWVGQVHYKSEILWETEPVSQATLSDEEGKAYEDRVRDGHSPDQVLEGIAIERATAKVDEVVKNLFA